MSFAIEFNASEGNAVQWMGLSGRLDSATAGDLEKTVASQFQAQGDKLVMDFAGLSYVSSAGLRVILMAAKRARQVQGTLILCGMQPHVREVFHISGFLKILHVVDSRDQAAQALQALAS
nr:STAS domain-containing protein [uncultured Rhodoferax sp.]